MNCCLIVVDSLRADFALSAGSKRQNFFEKVASRTHTFQKAYATECWTLPTHMSMFTGLLPSQHEAHLQTMGYRGDSPTIAELLAKEGFHTELVTRNSIFDGTMPGVTRGFQHNTLVLSDLKGLNVMSVVLALTKPRFRRQIETTGFFHPLQRDNREFLANFARATVPADREALGIVIDRIRSLRVQKKPFFIFANLYDVHAPYPPVEKSMIRPLLARNGFAEAVRMPFVLPRLGGHAYLAPDFKLSERNRQLLIDRYVDAVEMMSDKLSEFYAALEAMGALEDTLVIITSDHGEAFGDHGLYLHDSSVWQTHLHVPLHVHHPGIAPAPVEDIVSTKDLFGLMRAATLGHTWQDTILDSNYRQRHPIAIAEHFFSPHATHAAERYRQNLVAGIGGADKVILRHDGPTHFDLAKDPNETEPISAPIEDFAVACASSGIDTVCTEPAMAHFREWRHHNSA